MHSMTAREKLKKILESGDNEKNVPEFEAIIQSQLKSLKGEDMSLLLRWAVMSATKYFPRYYQVLINEGADVNFIDTREKKSNLMIACERPNIEIVEVLVNDKNIKFGLEDQLKKNALYYAIQNKNKEKSEKYIKLILEKDPSLLKAKSSKNNKTLLISAIEKARFQIIKVLLDQGADPNQEMTDDGNTPLHEAVKLMKSKCTQNIQQIIQYLLEKGADPTKENKKRRNALQASEKQEDTLRMIIEKVQRAKNAVKPILSINTAEERQKMFEKAAAIFKKNENCLEDSFDDDDDESQAEIEEDNEPYEDPKNFCSELSDQILNFQKECQRDFDNTEREIRKFLQDFEKIAKKLKLYVEVYGSFATGLWLKHCDIDLLLTPTNDGEIKTVDYYLEEIYKSLNASSKYVRVSILKTIKVPMIRVQVAEKMKKSPTRKIDITIFDMNHNGKQHVMYIEQLLSIYSELRPLFFVIKKLSHAYKLNDPKNNGIRTYAIVLMLFLFLQENKMQEEMQENQNEKLGDLLLRFLYKFGYNYDYDYARVDDAESMILNLPDPINQRNNVGNQTDVYSLQRMFKAAYIILHTKSKGSRLQFIFESKNMFA